MCWDAEERERGGGGGGGGVERERDQIRGKKRAIRRCRPHSCLLLEATQASPSCTSVQMKQFL